MLDTSKSATKPVMTRCGGNAVFLPFWAILCVLKMKSCINISEKIYDILHQDVSMIRTITATAIRDTDYNALGSYFVVHAILRLNMMGR